MEVIDREKHFGNTFGKTLPVCFSNILIFFILYPQKMSKNVDFMGFLKIKYGHLQAK